MSGKYDFPDIRKVRVLDYPENKIIEDRKNYPMGIIRAEVISPRLEVPYLPIRYKRSTLYPQECRMKGHWTLFELREAIEKYGYKLVYIEKAVIFDKLPFNIFYEFYNRLYEIKNNAKSDIERLMTKKIMNSVTGRFGYRRGERDEVEVHLKDYEKYKVKGYDGIRDVGDGKLIMSKSEEKEYSHYSSGVVYAHITAYARTMLYEHMIKIPTDQLLYVSTDAITFEGEENLKHFKIGNEIGEWKIEDSGKEFEGWNEQYYRIDDRIKASGVRKTDVNLKSIRAGKIETQALFTIRMSWKKGNFEDMGKFEDKVMNLVNMPKRMRQYPNEITEHLKSELLTGIEIAKKMREENIPVTDAV